ncbi:hypothetical protein PG989_014743 [Apiospora arundinis]
MSQLPHLPTELLMLIVEQLGGIREIVATASLNRRFREVCLHPAIQYRPPIDFNPWRRSRHGAQEDASLLLVHILQHDSLLVLQTLKALSRPFNTRRSPSFTWHDTCDSFTGRVSEATCEKIFENIPETAGIDMGFLLAAFLNDAPRISSALLNAGARVREHSVGKHELRYFHRAPGFLLVFEEVERVKDLEPLYLALRTPENTTQATLDAALRIACCYQCPRTVAYLLAHGADPNGFGRQGKAAIHYFALELNRVSLDERHVPLEYRVRSSSETSLRKARLCVAYGLEAQLMAPLLALAMNSDTVVYPQNRGVITRRANVDAVGAKNLQALLTMSGADRAFDLAFTIH